MTQACEGTAAAPARAGVGGFAFIIVMFVLLAIIGAVVVRAY